MAVERLDQNDAAIQLKNRSIQMTSNASVGLTITIGMYFPLSGKIFGQKKIQRPVGFHFFLDKKNRAAVRIPQQDSVVRAFNCVHAPNYSRLRRGLLFFRAGQQAANRISN
jgi:hypothetical protein